MRRLLEDFELAPSFAPAADMYETDTELVLEVDVPGYDESQLKVSVTDHTVTVGGERKEATEKASRQVHLHERLEARFERRFTLPADADAEHVRAEYDKGVLTVHVPRSRTVPSRTIEIEKR
jgi:HSP20 family protein